MDHEKDTGQPLNLPYDRVLEYLLLNTGTPEWKPRFLKTLTSRFVGLGLGLRTNAVWRSWDKKERIIAFDRRRKESTQKRVHHSTDCPKCQSYENMAGCLHPTQINGYSGKSYARKLPWRSIGGQTDIDWQEWCEMNPDFKDFGEDIDKWQ